MNVTRWLVAAPQVNPELEDRLMQVIMGVDMSVEGVYWGPVTFAPVTSGSSKKEVASFMITGPEDSMMAALERLCLELKAAVTIIIEQSCNKSSKYFVKKVYVEGNLLHCSQESSGTQDQLQDPQRIGRHKFMSSIPKCLCPSGSLNPPPLVEAALLVPNTKGPTRTTPFRSSSPQDTLTMSFPSPSPTYEVSFQSQPAVPNRNPPFTTGQGLIPDEHQEIYYEILPDLTARRVTVSQPVQDSEEPFYSNIPPEDSVRPRSPHYAERERAAEEIITEIQAKRVEEQQQQQQHGRAEAWGGRKKAVCLSSLSPSRTKVIERRKRIRQMIIRRKER
ncbi:hypothetical protein O3P69_015705 [Scylla paramamosain]|uniref:Uncharacterized protein n=1 Tax=Scylla paramamosain TaxID=85552 RepID=A0AAW0S9L2_SCYPA